MHIHKWTKWKDTSLIYEAHRSEGALPIAAEQTKECLVCGKKKSRRY